MTYVHKPLQFADAAAVVKAFRSGEKFSFVRTTTDRGVRINAVEDMEYSSEAGKFRALDCESTNGDLFVASGERGPKYIRSLFIALTSDLALPKPIEAAPKPKNEPIKPMPSDQPGILAQAKLPKAAPEPTKPQAIHVKPSAGLLTVTNPDDRRNRWGANE
jgi:hypothetical protein